MPAGPPPPPRSRRSPESDSHGSSGSGRAVDTEERPTGRHGSDQVARADSGAPARHGAPAGGRRARSAEPEARSFADVVRATGSTGRSGPDGARGTGEDGGTGRRRSRRAGEAAPATAAPGTGAPADGAPAHSAPANGAPVNGAPVNGTSANGSSNGSGGSGSGTPGPAGSGSGGNGFGTHGSGGNGSGVNGSGGTTKVGLRVRGGTVPREPGSTPRPGTTGATPAGPPPAAEPRHTTGPQRRPGAGGPGRPGPAPSFPAGQPTAPAPAGPVDHPGTGAPRPGTGDAHGAAPAPGHRNTGPQARPRPAPAAPSAPGAGPQSAAPRPGQHPSLPPVPRPAVPPTGATRPGPASAATSASTGATAAATTAVAAPSAPFPGPAAPDGAAAATRTGRRRRPEPDEGAGSTTDALPARTGGRRRRPGPGDAATALAPAAEAPTGLVPATAPRGDGGAPTALVAAPGDEAGTEYVDAAAPGPRRRRRAEPDGPFDRVIALVGPGVGVVRRRLGILDADQKAALSPEERRTRRRRQVVYSLVGTAASVVLLPLLLLGLGWLLFPIPSTDDAVQNQIATVSYADGGQLARLVPEQGNRIKVGMDAIPVHVREAVLAAEDRSFYSNPGFDFTGILRAMVAQLTGGVGGGSTITQQYVKNTLVGNDATYWRKYKELIVSLKVSGQKSKDEILNDYLNAIYFGRGAYGIESASLAYYGKPAAQLTPSEGALLAGIIQSPSNWDPANSPDRAKQRWNFVLDGMAAQGWISKADRQAAVFPQTIAPENTSRSSSLTDARGHILNAVRSELGSLGISEQAFAQGGLQVTTTIDPQRQQQLTDSVEQKLRGEPELLRTGAVAIDPRTGGILGYYGGSNGTGLDYAQVMKQPGSTFKPFAVLAGLLNDPPIGLGTTFDGSERPGLRNAEGANCPRCDLKQAMTISNNVVFTKLAAQVGPQKVADAARLAGITAPLENPDARLPLGNKEVTPVQLASAYATIAAGGVWHAPHMVSKVVDSDGRVLYEYQPGEGEQRFPEQVARNVVEAMMNVVDNDGLQLPDGQEAAGKTGTVQSRFEGQNNDAWFAGFTPGIATAVWVGTDRNDPIQDSAGRPINGADLPGSVWKAFMSDTVRTTGTAEFPAFRPIGESPSTLAPNEPTAPPTPTSTPSAEPTPEPSTDPVAPTDPPAPVEPTGVPEPTGDPVPAQQDETQPGADAGRAADPTVG
ncbi:transglycosylase domain-containing protein [Pseudonocardia sp. ICBG601]|uniref:transglycosylase domain-containing protein n=1 Tax=Pseudonocardia sp. ICBG601 TaxID=2846759 RepID=UPI0021F517FC|nr:transglycosylase domain-containing protein [Pseudonocardia sp. ICBG601]